MNLFPSCVVRLGLRLGLCCWYTSCLSVDHFPTTETNNFFLTHTHAETTDDDDEVLVVIAEKLGELTGCVGGPEHVYRLLAPLELLASVEESSVREATIKSISSVADAMPSDHILKYYCPFVVALSSKDWYTARITATSLFHNSYSRIPESNAHSFRALFLTLCADDTSVVRRSAAINLCKMAKVVKPTELWAEFMEALQKLSSDEQDSIRVQIVPNCVAFATVLPQEVKLRHILPLVLLIASDRSWRVRWSLANQLHEICQVFGEQVTNNSLSEAAISILGDVEAEVRSSAAAHLAPVCSVLSRETIVVKIVPAVQRLVTDASEHVRASIASVIGNVVGILGREDTVTHLLPLLLLLLRDEVSEVRLNIILNLGGISQVVGVELLGQSLLPAIVELSEDSKWRVRLAIIERIPLLADKLGRAFFSAKLVGLCINWLGDEVYSIRRASAENLKGLVELLGEGWAAKDLLPKIEIMITHTSHLQRMTALHVIQVIAPKLSTTLVESVCLPMALRLTTDTVPNVRFTVVRTLKVIYQLMASMASGGDNGNGNGNGNGRGMDVCNTVSTIWTNMAKDSDRDVRFFANKSLSEMQ